MKMDVDKAPLAIHDTESLCPICLCKISARHVRVSDDIMLEKTCPQHGDFSTVIWRGQGEPGYDSWKREVGLSSSIYCMTETGKGCPYDCGQCPEHRQQTCCVLLEVTSRCNLNCSVCFAGSGEGEEDPSFEEVGKWLDILCQAGRPFIHLSGGEPTVRDDLPEIIDLSREKGFSYIQLNTNGLRLAQEPDYAKKLVQSGLSCVFMQFDGTNDKIYKTLRNRPLFSEKEKAIRNCFDNNLGVVLVPMIVPGTNVDNIGDIIRFGLANIPAVRGIHFQSVSYFGRYPDNPKNSQRITLPEILREIESQTGATIKVEDFSPSGCDHARCGFHGNFVMMPDGRVEPLTQWGSEDSGACCCEKSPEDSAVQKNRNFVARRWAGQNIPIPTPEKPCSCAGEGMGEWETFLRRTRTHEFSITGMVFQDCWNLDLERLSQCSLHVLDQRGKLIPFCAYYLSSVDGKRLYGKKG